MARPGICAVAVARSAKRIKDQGKCQRAKPWVRLQINLGPSGILWALGPRIDVVQLRDICQILKIDFLKFVAQFERCLKSK